MKLKSWETVVLKSWETAVLKVSLRFAFRSVCSGIPAPEMQRPWKCVRCSALCKRVPCVFSGGPQVAFSASLSNFGEIYKGPCSDTTLVFKRVFSNIGNGYDQHTGRLLERVCVWKTACLPEMTNLNCLSPALKQNKKNLEYCITFVREPLKMRETPGTSGRLGCYLYLIS